jgi:hypothetical protein
VKTAEALLHNIKKLPLRVFCQHGVDIGGDLHGPRPKVKLRPAFLGVSPGAAGPQGPGRAAGALAEITLKGSRGALKSLA